MQSEELTEPTPYNLPSFNPEETTSKLPAPFKDCTPDMVKDKDFRRRQVPIVSQFFCSPEPSALILMTPDSYS